MTPAEVREPEARYSSTAGATPIHVSEVPISLETLEALPERALALVTVEPDHTASGGDLIVIGQPAERAYGSSYLAEVDEEGTVRFRSREGKAELVVEPTALFSAMGAFETMRASATYDRFSERFLIVALARTRDAEGVEDSSLRIFVGVSQAADPQGEWFALALEIPQAGDAPAGAGRLVVDAEKLFIVARAAVTPDGQGRVWVIDKGVDTGGFYAGGLAQVYRWSPGK